MAPHAALASLAPRLDTVHMLVRNHVATILLSLALALALAVAACGEAAPAHTAPYDSAGVAIIPASTVGSLPEWRLPPEPSLALGGAGADREHELYEAISVLRLDDGRVLVANAGNHELRFYSPGGDLLETVGRQGGGPGEYEGIWGVARLRGDSLGVWDWRQKRLTIYDGGGAFGRMTRPAEPGMFFPRLLGALDDGESYLLIGGFNPGDAIRAGGGTWQDERYMLRYSLEGGPPDSLGPFLTSERYVEVGDGSMWLRDIPFGRQEHIAAGGGYLFTGDDRTGEVRVHDPLGGLVRIIRTGFPTRRVTDADVEAYRQSRLEDTPEDQLPELRRRLDLVPWAERTPAFEDLFADRLGRAWVAEFTGPHAEPDSPRTWTIFGADGHALARLRIPRRARPVDAGEDYVIVYSRDGLDIETLAVHQLRRGEG